MKRTRVLITGGSGFVGSHIARRLAESGWDLHIVTIPNDNCELLKEIDGQITYHVHDGSSRGMLEIMEQASPELVFHLASLFLSEHTTEKIEPLIRSNLLFGVQLADAMACCGCRFLVNTGTSWEHYQGDAYSPVNLYAATKQAFEALLQYYVEAKSLQTVTLKLFDTYGDNDPRPKLLNLLKRVSETGESLAMSPGEQLIDLVHVDDVVSAFCLASERLLLGRVSGHERYAVSSGEPIALKELVAVYERIVGRRLPIVWGGRQYRFREVMVPWSNGPLLPGWKPEVSLEDGIRRCCA